MIYQIEKHTTIEWVVTARKEGDNLRNVIAKCPAEGIALTIKGMYEKEEQQDLEQDMSLKGLCRQLVEACEGAKRIARTSCHAANCGCCDCESNLTIRQEIESALEAAKKEGQIEP